MDAIRPKGECRASRAITTRRGRVPKYVALMHRVGAISAAVAQSSVVPRKGLSSRHENPASRIVLIRESRTNRTPSFPCWATDRESGQAYVYDHWGNPMHRVPITLILIAALIIIPRFSDGQTGRSLFKGPNDLARTQGGKDTTTASRRKRVRSSSKISVMARPILPAGRQAKWAALSSARPRRHALCRRKLPQVTR